MVLNLIHYTSYNTDKVVITYLKGVIHMGYESKKVYKEFEKCFINWANSIEDIRAAFVVGSRARQDHPADEWSDLDIIIYSTNPQFYLTNSDWVENIGDILCSFVFQTAGGDPERLCLFKGGWQIDFVIHSNSELKEIIGSGLIPTNFYRGVRSIIDKDNISEKVIPSIYRAPDYMQLNEEVFIQNVNMFWFASLYIAKQLLRRELWIAKARDNNIKELLLQMIEWYSKAINGNDYDTWHAGRFINEWAPDDVLTDLKDSFGQYNEADSWSSLFSTMNLFKRISRKVAELLDYSYPLGVENHISDWIKTYAR